MKITKLLTTVVLALVFCANANAKIWRVSQDTTIAATFVSIQDVHDAATAGDTIFIESGSYSTTSVTKKLVFYGTGYTSTTVNSKFLFNKTSASFSLNAGSDGSEIHSLSGFVTINSISNILVEDISGIVTINSSSATSFSSDILIKKSIVDMTSNSSYTKNVFVSNSVLWRGYSSYYYIDNVILDHCVIPSDYCRATNSSFSNCIFLSPSTFSVSSKNVISYSLCNSNITLDNYSLGDNNVIGKLSSSDIFISTSAGEDFYRLNETETNPALTAGTNNDQVGIYGGGDTFNNYGGVPSNFPIILNIATPITVGDQMEVTVKAKVLY